MYFLYKKMKEIKSVLEKIKNGISRLFFITAKYTTVLFVTFVVPVIISVVVLSLNNIDWSFLIKKFEKEINSMIPNATIEIESLETIGFFIDPIGELHLKIKNINIHKEDGSFDMKATQLNMKIDLFSLIIGRFVPIIDKISNAKIDINMDQSQNNSESATFYTPEDFVVDIIENAFYHENYTTKSKKMLLEDVEISISKNNYKQSLQIKDSFFVFTNRSGPFSF